MSSWLAKPHDPNRIALFSDEGKVFTYGQLRDEVTIISNALPRRQLMFFLGRNDVSAVKTYLACFESGTVPLLLDPSISRDLLVRLLSVYVPKYVFLPKLIAETLEGYEVFSEIGGYVLCCSGRADGPELHADLSLLLTTSGTTGSPKLVRLSWRNLYSNAQSIVDYLGIESTDRAITSLPFYYSYGISVLHSYLCAGASIVLSNRNFFDPLFWQQMKSLEVTSMAGVPYSYEILLKLHFERMELPALKTLTQAGGKMPLERTQRILEICEAKNIRFFTMYGQTEAAPRMAYLSPEYSATKLGSIGKAIPGGRLWLEDEHGATIEQPGQIGELIYSGPNVALGYAEIRDDLKRGDDWCGLLRTGDLARQDEQGFFYIEGRKSRFIKIFGVRLSVDAVETWFAQHGVVAAAYGSDDCLQVTLECVQQDKCKDFAKILSTVMRIHPSALNVSAISVLPRLATGKVDYSCLEKKH
ncbi:AMP-binding protein [beta proteobacterium MWH-UniP1]